MSAYKEAIVLVTRRHDLSRQQAAAVMEEIMNGALQPTQIAAFLAALATKGETVEEFTGLAQVLREHAVEVSAQGRLLDTCGTGGSGLDTPNTSTLCGFVLAAGGVKVAKHGNRSSTGRCGSADVLERLGVNIEITPEQVVQLLDEQGFAFMMAPKYHPAMRHAGPVRKQLGVRTSFNFLGPLANPAQVQFQVLGVSDKTRAPLMAATLASLGVERALVVTGHDGLDEITLTGPSHAWHIENGKVSEQTIRPKELGLSEVDASQIKGGSPEYNIELFQAVLAGKASGPISDLVAINAAAGFWIYGSTPSLVDGIEMAKEIISSGKAHTAFQRYRDQSQALAP